MDGDGREVENGMNAGLDKAIGYILRPDAWCGDDAHFYTNLLAVGRQIVHVVNRQAVW